MDGRLRTGALYLKRRLLRPWLYRYPPFDLQPERLYLWTDALMRARETPGAIVEVGCSLGGTAAWCDRMLRQSGVNKRYICVDTFGGFVEHQFTADLAFGTSREVRRAFGANSVKLTRRVVDGLGAPDVELIPGDIASLSADRLPARIAACLIDVDLYQPIYAALEMVWPRLSPGGTILVDDCSENETHYKAAREAYRRFVTVLGLAEEYRFSMGVLTAPAASATAAPARTDLPRDR